MENSKCLDLEHLRSQFNESQIEAILKSYLSTTPPIVEDIKQAIQVRDAKELEAKAHLLKGASGMITANEILRLCKKLEEIGSTGNWDNDNVDKLCAELEKSFEQIKSELSD